MVEVLKGMGVDPGDALLLGSLKDPVRVHEKGLDDYFGRFEDSVIPEACVVDVVRARVILDDGPTLVKFLSRLRDGIEVTVGGKPARLELLRLKNKFTVNDPTHFRNVLGNLRLHWDAKSSMVEVQVHHRAILAYNNRAHAHAHYDFFRSILRDDYEAALGSDLDFMLETRMIVFDRVCSVPVLLSMLCLTLSHGEESFAKRSSSANFPPSVSKLYETALRKRIARGSLKEGHDELSIFELLQTVAVASHRGQRREFTSTHATECLAERGDLARLWHVLEGEEGGIPFIKTLAGASGGKDGEYQFTHLSLQEYLMAHALVNDDAVFAATVECASVAEISVQKVVDSVLRGPFYKNVRRLGGMELAARTMDVVCKEVETLSLKDLSLAQRRFLRVVFEMEGRPLEEQGNTFTKFTGTFSLVLNQTSIASAL